MASAAAAGALAHKRVLVVEDEYFIADDMAQALRDLGAEVVGPVPSRETALNVIAKSDQIDFAVLDINLSGEAVFPVADALKARDVPFVFATGYEQASVPSAYQDAVRWEKPFDPDDLARALPRLMEQRS